MTCGADGPGYRADGLWLIMTSRNSLHAVLAAFLPSAACAAARRAMGTRKGEQET